MSLGAQAFSFLCTCLMCFIDKKHTHCQVSGLEAASPMVRLVENLVVFCVFLLTFYLLFYPGAQSHKDFPAIFHLISSFMETMAICGMVLFCACSTQVLSLSISEMSNLSPYARYTQDLVKFNSL